LVTQGVRLPIDEDFLQCLAAARLWDGTPVPDGLQQRVRRVWGATRAGESPTGRTRGGARRARG
jgi:hypothetical protein